MTGTLTSLGDYDQCLRIEHVSQEVHGHEEPEEVVQSEERNEEKDQVTTDWRSSFLSSASESRRANEREKEGSRNERPTTESEANDKDDDYDHDLNAQADSGDAASGAIGSFNGKDREEVNSKDEKDHKRSRREADEEKEGTKRGIKRKVIRGQYCLLRSRPVLPPPDFRTSLQDVVVNVSNTVLDDTVYRDIAKIAHGFYSIPLQFALCIPSTCDAREIENVIRTLLDPIHFTATLGPSCDVRTDHVVMDKAQVFALVVMSIVVFVVLLFSMVDVLLGSCLSQNQESKDGQQTMKNSFLAIISDSFSISKNVSKLFNLKTESEPKLHFIHGMRVLTMIWVIICHTYTFGTQFLTAIGSVRIDHEILPLSRTMSMQFILNGWFSVETFFFLR